MTVSVETSNGIRMVLALALVSYAFAFGMPLHTWVRLIILVSSPILTILCNVLRLAVVLWLYGHAGRLWAGWVHRASGWVLVPLIFGLLLGILRWMRRAKIPVEPFVLAYD